MPRTSTSPSSCCYRNHLGWTLTALAVVILGIASNAGAATAEAEAAVVAGTPERFVAAINTADGAGLTALIDVGALGSRVLGNLDLNAVDRARYLASLRAQFAMLGHSVVAQLAAQRAKAALVRDSPANKGGEFMARITTSDARDNLAHGYLQVSLDREGRIVDWYDHSLAMSMSGQLAFNAVGMLTTGEVAQLLFGGADGALASAALMQRFTSAITAGDMKGAYALMDDMPDSIKGRQEFATLRVTFARSVGMDAYRQALADLASKHGTADELQFILIDHYLLTGQSELGLRAVDRAARIVGDDEVMDANRCHVLLELRRKADALAACDRAIARDPAFETPRWTRVRIGLNTKDAPLAIESLTAIEQAPGGKRLKAGSLAKLEPYAWLITQPEFAAWGAERGWSQR